MREDGIENMADMQYVKYPRAEVITLGPREYPWVCHVADTARTCFRKNKDADHEADLKTCRALYSRGHMTPFEFADVTFRCECSVKCANQVVRHRVASYMQESSRYVDLLPMKVVLPSDASVRADKALEAYIEALNEIPEIRDNHDLGSLYYPACRRTVLIVKMNLRSLWHFLELRTSPAAHPEIRTLAMRMRQALLDELTVPQDRELVLLGGAA